MKTGPAKLFLMGYARTVVLLASPVLAGMLAGYLTGGRLTLAAGLRPRALWLLWLAH